MTKDELRNNLSEIALAVATSNMSDGDSLFDRGDDVTLLPLGFEFIDSTAMSGTVGGVRWWVDLDAKRCPRWSYAIIGKQSTPSTYGPMPYDEVANGLVRVSDRLVEEYYNAD
jgi:hypothetical protein